MQKIKCSTNLLCFIILYILSCSFTFKTIKLKTNILLTHLNIKLKKNKYHHINVQHKSFRFSYKIHASLKDGIVLTNIYNIYYLLFFIYIYVTYV